MRLAIVVLTRAGLDLAGRIRAARPDDEVVIFAPSCVAGACRGPLAIADPGLPPGGFRTDEPGVAGWLGPLRTFLPGVWGRFEGIVAVMALGIVVRLVGPLASDKRSDPAVVVVDDAGRFAISVLGGHGAGANALTQAVAAAIGAQAVVTTASESRGLPAVDQIGRDLGWVIERRENLTRVAAAVVRGRPVAIWQDAGSPDWWRPFGPWPATFVRPADLDEVGATEPDALLVISDRVLGADPLPGRTLLYRPPSLVAGIGCKRGTPAGAIADFVESVLDRFGLATASLARLATVTLKADEPGLLEFAESRRLPLLAYPPDRLAGHPGIETPSERVRDRVGIPAVSEPAALVAAGARRLLIPKQIGPGITCAIARIPPADPTVQGIEAGTGPKAGA